MYIICKTLPAYKYEDVIAMPHILKELLYQFILYDYGTTNATQEDDGFIDLDSAELDEIQMVLGKFRQHDR